MFGTILYFLFLVCIPSFPTIIFFFFCRPVSKTKAGHAAACVKLGEQVETIDKLQEGYLKSRVQSRTSADAAFLQVLRRLPPGTDTTPNSGEIPVKLLFSSYRLILLLTFHLLCNITFSLFLFHFSHIRRPKFGRIPATSQQDSILVSLQSSKMSVKSTKICFFLDTRLRAQRKTS